MADARRAATSSPAPSCGWRCCSPRIVIVLVVVSSVVHVPDRAVGPAGWRRSGPRRGRRDRAGVRARARWARCAGSWSPSTRVIVVLVGAGGLLYARRTLRPIRDNVAAQKRFVADASHDLRTPLADHEGGVRGGAAPTRTWTTTARPVLVSGLEEVDRMSEHGRGPAHAVAHRRPPGAAGARAAGPGGAGARRPSDELATLAAPGRRASCGAGAGRGRALGRRRRAARAPGAAQRGAQRRRALAARARRSRSRCAQRRRHGRGGRHRPRRRACRRRCWSTCSTASTGPTRRARATAAARASAWPSPRWALRGHGRRPQGRERGRRRYARDAHAAGRLTRPGDAAGRPTQPGGERRRHDARPRSPPRRAPSSRHRLQRPQRDREAAGGVELAAAVDDEAVVAASAARCARAARPSTTKSAVASASAKARSWPMTVAESSAARRARRLRGSTRCSPRS